MRIFCLLVLFFFPKAFCRVKNWRVGGELFLKVNWYKKMVIGKAYN